jgi:hypothetical protein
MLHLGAEHRQVTNESFWRRQIQVTFALAQLCDRGTVFCTSPFVQFVDGEKNRWTTWQHLTLHRHHPNHSIQMIISRSAKSGRPDLIDVVTFPVSRETEPYEGAREILPYLVHDEIIGRCEPEARASPRFGGDTRIKARKSSFEFIQRVAVPIRLGLIAYGSEDRIDIQEYKSLSNI